MTQCDLKHYIVVPIRWGVGVGGGGYTDLEPPIEVLTSHKLTKRHRNITLKIRKIFSNKSMNTLTFLTILVDGKHAATFSFYISSHEALNISALDVQAWIESENEV